MKKLIAIALALALCAGLMAGCGAREEKPQENPSYQQEQKPAEKPAETQAPAEQKPEEKPEEKKEETPAEPPFRLSKEEYPRVDGSTVTIPLSEAFYSMLTDSTAEEAALAIKHNKTHSAYVNLINGDCDIIFVTSPSEEEQQLAKDASVELEVVPIVSEAFVFLTSADNKVEGLTHQQILDIYSGKITNWKEVGGDDVPIRAFQRPVNSGSQTGMIDLVMGDTPLADPPTELVTAFMGELVDAVATYENEPDAIGYSYYYYVNDMWGYNKTKLLAIDGVKPDNSTVADGSYRYHTAYYAVIRGSEAEDSTVRKMLAWILSEEGQKLAEDTGYVRVGK
ncbi:MAG: substrate-binding domain-containing protein [Firmicutes bacterium]|nr:substrate-binding domain-containing protein [Bacillota bacterium]